MEVDYFKLYDLRKKTRLNLIEKLKLIKLRNLEKLKVAKMKYIAEKTTKVLNEKEHCHLGVDFREADQFEFEKRLSRYNRKMRGKYGRYY